MKREVMRTIDGKEAIRLTPETDEDLAELERLEAAGQLDAYHSFADHHERMERESRLKRKKGEAA